MLVCSRCIPQGIFLLTFWSPLTLSVFFKVWEHKQLPSYLFSTSALNHKNPFDIGNQTKKAEADREGKKPYWFIDRLISLNSWLQSHDCRKFSICTLDFLLRGRCIFCTRSCVPVASQNFCRSSLPQVLGWMHRKTIWKYLKEEMWGERGSHYRRLSVH